MSCNCHCRAPIKITEETKSTLSDLLILLINQKAALEKLSPPAFYKFPTTLGDVIKSLEEDIQLIKCKIDNYINSNNREKI